jgi:hypothetical protein
VAPSATFPNSKLVSPKSRRKKRKGSPSEYIQTRMDIHKDIGKRIERKVKVEMSHPTLPQSNE